MTIIAVLARIALHNGKKNERERPKDVNCSIAHLQQNHNNAHESPKSMVKGASSVKTRNNSKISK